MKILKEMDHKNGKIIIKKKGMKEMLQEIRKVNNKRESHRTQKTNKARQREKRNFKTITKKRPRITSTDQLVQTGDEEGRGAPEGTDLRQMACPISGSAPRGVY